MKNLLLLLTIAVFMGCNQTEQVSDQKYDVDYPFENGVSMEETSIDPMGNIFAYPEGEAGITGQTDFLTTFDTNLIFLNLQK